jgi:hypothetical protein
MKAKFLIAAAAIMTSSAPLLAQELTPLPEPAYTNALFRGKEISLDLFGSISVGQQTINHLSGDRVTNDGRFGAGAGLSYYFTRYVGIGADAYSENTAHNFVDDASGNLFLRLPLESAHLAPYVFGGGGYQFDDQSLGFGQLGGGLEVRVTHFWGLFIDARYKFLGEGADDVGLGRAGLRFVF